MRFAMSPDLTSPWKEFLEELDSFLSEPVEFRCIGGFAAVAAYGLPRSTNDLDYITLVPGNYQAELEESAGQGSPTCRGCNRTSRLRRADGGILSWTFPKHPTLCS